MRCPVGPVGQNVSALLGVSMLPNGRAWAVGYYINGDYRQKTLTHYYDGTVWKVVKSPNPGKKQNLLYGVAAISDCDVWAVGAEQDETGLWHTLTVHWDGDEWSVVPAVDVGVNGNQFFAVTALGPDKVYAVGQQAGVGFPGKALIERWDGHCWQVLPEPHDRGQTLLPLGVTATEKSLTLVGQAESDTSPTPPWWLLGDRRTWTSSRAATTGRPRMTCSPPRPLGMAPPGPWAGTSTRRLATMTPWWSRAWMGLGPSSRAPIPVRPSA